jgi:transcriptional regulator GlxA family with amidase domain
MSFETGCRKADRERFCKDFQKCFKGLPAYSESLREHCLFMLGQAARILGEELVAAEEAAASRGPRVLREAKDYIEAHCRRCLPLREVAAAVGVSPAHLSRLFSRHQGGGFAAAVRRERLGHAASMLSEARAPVTEVAFAAGFQSLSQFNRSFKAHYGLTPRAYRRSRQLRPSA